MSQQIINLGTGPNTKDGDPVRVAFTKVNANFTELYSSSAIPSQSGNSGKYITTNGTAISWSQTAVPTDVSQLTDLNYLMGQTIAATYVSSANTNNVSGTTFNGDILVNTALNTVIAGWYVNGPGITNSIIIGVNTSTNTRVITINDANFAVGETYYFSSNPFKFYNPHLPADRTGYLYNDGSGKLSWGQGTNQGGAVTTSDTAPQFPNNGDFWYDSVSGSLFIRYNNNWVAATSDIGPKGFTGSAGSPGGYTGSAGAGYTGSLGYTGSTGAGYTGSIGYTGSAGAGYTGSAGIGYTGSSGAYAAVGYTGSAGPNATGSYDNIPNTIVQRDVYGNITIARLLATDIHLGPVNPTISDRNSVMQITTNVNTYAQMWQQNTSDGQYASTDYVVTNDVGTDSSHYLDMGINSSNYADSSFTITGSNDGYLYVQDGNIAIGTSSVLKDVVFFTGGTLSTNEAGRIHNGRWLLGASDDNSSKLQVNGSISNPGNPNTTYHYDTTTGTITVLNNGTVNFSNFSGTVVVNDHTSGSVTLWLCGGGSATALGSSTSASGTITLNGSINGYTWTNTTGGSRSFSFVITRTNTSS